MKYHILLLASALCTAIPSVIFAETAQISAPIMLAERGGGPGFAENKRLHGGYHGKTPHNYKQRAVHQNTKHPVTKNTTTEQKAQNLKTTDQNINHNNNWNNNGYHEGWNGYHTYNNTNVYYVNGSPYNGWYNGSYLWGGVAAMGLIAGTYYYAGKAYSTSAQCYGACAAANNPTVNCHSVCNY